MSLARDVIREIVNRLKPLGAYLVILYGSAAEAHPDEAHDIDIAVVLNCDDLPASFEERMQNAVLVEALLFDLSARIPVDITVYTRAEFERLNARDEPFASVLHEGKVLCGVAS